MSMETKTNCPPFHCSGVISNRYNNRNITKSKNTQTKLSLCRFQLNETVYLSYWPTDNYENYMLNCFIKQICIQNFFLYTQEIWRHFLRLQIIKNWRWKQWLFLTESNICSLSVFSSYSSWIPLFSLVLPDMWMESNLDSSCILHFVFTLRALSEAEIKQIIIYVFICTVIRLLAPLLAIVSLNLLSVVFKIHKLSCRLLTLS